MRYGKIQYNDWFLEFRFNWKENMYDIVAIPHPHHPDPSEKFLGLAWKNPRKSRPKPCWEALLLHHNGEKQWLADSEQLRQAAITLLEYHLSQYHPPT